jgi:hypothetical protein
MVPVSRVSILNSTPHGGEEERIVHCPDTRDHRETLAQNLGMSIMVQLGIFQLASCLSEASVETFFSKTEVLTVRLLSLDVRRASSLAIPIPQPVLTLYRLKAHLKASAIALCLPLLLSLLSSEPLRR